MDGPIIFRSRPRPWQPPYMEGDIVVADSGDARQLRRDPESPTGWTWVSVDFKPRWYHYLLGFGFNHFIRR